MVVSGTVAARAVTAKAVTALAVWAALGGAALFYGKTAGLVTVTAVFVYTLVKRRKKGALALLLGAAAGIWGLYRSAEAARPLFTLAPVSGIRVISGKIAGAPAITGGKQGRERYYRLFLEAEEVTTGGGASGDEKTACYSAQGKAIVFVPAAFIETFFPDRLYSRSGTGGMPFFVQGESVTFAVYPSGGTVREGPTVFTAEKVLAWKDPPRGDYIRGILRLQYRRLIFGWGRAGGLLLALTAASREYLDVNTAEAFTAAGLAHVLALSGMHLSIIGGGAAFLGRRLGGRKAALCCTCAGAAFFVWFAGGSPSLIRALIFLCLSVLGRVLYLPPAPVNTLSAAFLVQMILFPQDASSLSFILSYGALAGIFLAGKLLERVLAGTLPKPVLSPFAASTGAQLATAPVMVYSFGCLMPGGIIASMAVSPLVSLFLGAGIGAVFVSLLVPPLCGFLGIVLNMLCLPLEKLVFLFARIPALKIGGTTGTILVTAEVILIYVGLCFLRAAERKKLYVRFARL
ncbi:MAG: ComEC/Rec2 family competence protein [Spirochaetaceae bacterium]|jgi:competence protein ComEC|nr:ComEC/Rec2 family competence protein [Spirochaetaceae bacterium]